jgi:hypothetical protein
MSHQRLVSWWWRFRHAGRDNPQRSQRGPQPGDPSISVRAGPARLTSVSFRCARDGVARNCRAGSIARRAGGGNGGTALSRRMEVSPFRSSAKVTLAGFWRCRRFWGGSWRTPGRCRAPCAGWAAGGNMAMSWSRATKATRNNSCVELRRTRTNTSWRAKARHPRLSCVQQRKSWMPTFVGMTGKRASRPSVDSFIVGRRQRKLLTRS